MISYDALIIAAKILDLTTEDASLTALKEAFESTLNDYSGITGTIKLNTARDRENGNYFYWTVIVDGNSYKWEHTATYTDGVIINVK